MIDTVRKYFSLLETFVTDSSQFAAILHPSFTQVEFPNTLNKTGQASDLPDVFRRMELGKKALAKQHYEITNFIEGKDQVCVEADWSGTLTSGKEMKAHFCIVCEFKDGKLFRQRNYDCFEPF